MSIRSAIDQALTLIGVVIVVVPVTLLSESWIPLFLVMGGTLLIGAGAWRLGTRLLPNRRVFIGLRSEVEYFIKLVRRLNSHALEEDTKVVEEVRVEMKESVDRMVSLAGQAS